MEKSPPTDDSTMSGGCGSLGRKGRLGTVVVGEAVGKKQGESLQASTSLKAPPSQSLEGPRALRQFRCRNR